MAFPAPSEVTLPTPASSANFGLPSVSAAPTRTLVLAQQFDQDILGDLGGAFKTFIDSGQVWALIIGIVIGYLFRSMTTYK
ncbi:MAG: hypothetical protein VKJ09_05300 [Leptolyngbya sp.]|nr:hypothetical protein [Leptolyngbya sp.]